MERKKEKKGNHIQNKNLKIIKVVEKKVVEKKVVGKMVVEKIINDKPMFNL